METWLFSDGEFEDNFVFRYNLTVKKDSIANFWSQVNDAWKEIHEICFLGLNVMRFSLMNYTDYDILGTSVLNQFLSQLRSEDLYNVGHSIFQ